MKSLLTVFYSLLFVVVCYAQETVLQTRKLTKNTQEVVNVLKTNTDIKQGLYQVRYRKNIALVSGMYTNNKKTGIWHYFDYTGKLIQNYDYDRDKITYEAPDDDITGFKYLFDKKINNTDLVTKPIRIGGRYYGYLSYLNVFIKPDDAYGIENDNLTAFVELLISPGGHLADYNIHLVSYNYDRMLNVNLNLLSEDDKRFVPATINHEAVSSRIAFYCHVAGNGKLIFWGVE